MPPWSRQPKTSRTATRNGDGSYNLPITDEIKAAIWVRAEEGKSQRAIARDLVLSATAVNKVLAENPVRYEALRARLRDERARQWQEIEAAGQRHTRALLEIVGKRASNARLLKPQAIDDLAVRARALQAIRHTTESGSKMTQLLTGGATDRVETMAAKTAEEMTADDIVELAIADDKVAELPPGLRAYALRLQAERAHKP